MTSITQNGDRWEIVGDVLMDHANGLLEKSKTLTLSQSTVIDFVHVAELDTSAVSLMLEWRRRALAEGKEVKFSHLPEGLTSLAKLYDVVDLVI